MKKNCNLMLITLSTTAHLELIEIPSGTFLMGEKSGYSDEQPQHKVSVSKFFLGRFPVTQIEWKAIASETDLKVDIDLDPNPSYCKGDRRPVECVTWNEAIEYCNRLSNLTGDNCRLPSEAEWEYACKAGTTTNYCFGDTIDDTLAHVNEMETAWVGCYPSNDFGIYDMHGNVCEFCADTWHCDYTGAPVDGNAWVEKQPGQKDYPVLRGGSWMGGSLAVRSSARGVFKGKNTRCINIGFRVACDIHD